MSTVGDFRTRFAQAMSLYEAKAPSKEKQVYFDAYRKAVGLGEPRGTKSQELIRAPFGADLDGTAEDNIKNMFTSAGKKVSSIEYFAKGQVRQGKNLGSNDYASYKIILDDNSEVWVTNATVELEHGGNQEISKKDLTPAKLGVSGIIFKDVNSLIKVIEGNIKMQSSISKDTQNFLISLATSGSHISLIFSPMNERLNIDCCIGYSHCDKAILLCDQGIGNPKALINTQD